MLTQRKESDKETEAEIGIGSGSEQIGKCLNFWGDERIGGSD